MGNKNETVNTEKKDWGSKALNLVSDFLNPKNKDLETESKLESNAKFDSQADREKLKSAIEKSNWHDCETYELGQGETARENAKEIPKEEPVSLYGSVDSTGFESKWHEADWYKPYFEAASTVLKCESLMNESTKKWFESVKPAVLNFAELDGFKGKKPKEEKKKYQSEIWSLVKKNGTDSVYGKDGVLNFLLAFRRITNIFPDLKNAKNADFDLASLNIDKIELSLGYGKGKEEGKNDRWAYVVVHKEESDFPEIVNKANDEEKEPDEQVVPEPEQQVKADQGSVEPKQVFVAPISEPELADNKGNEEVLEENKEEIEKPTEEELEVFNPYLDTLEFEIKLPDGSVSKKIQLDDGKFWDEIKNLTPLEYSKFEGVFSSFEDLQQKVETLRDDYPEYFEDFFNLGSLKLQKLHFWLTKRLLEYSNDSAYNLYLFKAFKFIGKVDEKDYPDKEFRKSVIDQFKKSFEYLKNNSVDLMYFALDFDIDAL